MSLNYVSDIEQGKLEDALSKIFNAIEEEPGNVTHYINASIVLHRAGRDDEAEKFLQKALTIDKHSSSALYTLGNLYFDNQRYVEAIKIYLMAYSLIPDNADLNYMIAMCYKNIEQIEQAIIFFENARKIQPLDSEINFQYGLLMCQLKKYDIGEKLLKTVVNHLDHADAEYNLGLIYYTHHNNIDQALTHLERAISIQEDHHLAHYAKSKILLK